MVFLEVLGAKSADIAVDYGIQQLLKARWRFLTCRVWRPSGVVRVSYSALLRMAVAGKYILIKNLHRRGTFAPIGGVYKRLPNSHSALDAIEFRPQEVTSEMAADLRGFIARRHLGAFDEWFHSGLDRELHSDCLRRELREELTEIGISSLAVPETMHFRLVRIVTEGPSIVPGEGYDQYRMFQVYDLVDSVENTEFAERLAMLAAEHEGLLPVTAQEIRRGRAADGRHIAHHAAYFFQARRLHGDEPLFATGG